MASPSPASDAYLAQASGADAQIGRLDLRGGLQRHHNYVALAAANVPLPAMRVQLELGPCLPGRGACYIQLGRARAIIYLTRAGSHGWTYLDERVALLHELGHGFDTRHMTRRLRDEFRELAQTSCSWWSQRCYLPREPGSRAHNVPPAEMFAEMYAACALAVGRAWIDERSTVSYGWNPPPRTEPAMCALVRRAGRAVPPGSKNPQR